MGWRLFDIRPLDRLRSIRVKLGAVVVIAVVATVGVIVVALELGLPARYAFAAAVLLSLVVIQVLAHGMVLPLREMAAATETMAQGDHTRRVTATSQDEVGTLARSFNDMAAKLDQVEVQRQELLANVSHELRTPIASLRARLENLADGVEEMDDAVVRSMLTSTERLSDLVDQLLELSQFESGAIHITPGAMPAHDLVASAVEEVGPVRGEVGIVVDVPSDLAVRGDRWRLHEVLTNLLTNAVRHSPSGTVVSVHARPTSAGVRVEVVDEGPGIPGDELDAVFDRFHRLDAARSANAGGAGLGLAISRSIVELHGGTIAARPNHPTGCRMVVDLPG